MYLLSVEHIQSLILGGGVSSTYVLCNPPNSDVSSTHNWRMSKWNHSYEKCTLVLSSLFGGRNLPSRHGPKSCGDSERDLPTIPPWFEY